MLTLTEAARLAGVSKTTLTRAIRAGKLTATPLEDGGFAIDAKQLARVYKVKLQSPPVVAAVAFRPIDPLPLTAPSPLDLPRLAEPDLLPTVEPLFSPESLAGDHQHFDLSAPLPLVASELPAVEEEPLAVVAAPVAEAPVSAMPADEPIPPADLSVEPIEPPSLEDATSDDPLGPEDAELAARVATLDAEIKGLRDLLAEVKASRDELRGERDEWRGRADRLLQDLQRPWWRRLAG